MGSDAIPLDPDSKIADPLKLAGASVLFGSINLGDLMAVGDCDGEATREPRGNRSTWHPVRMRRRVIVRVGAILTALPNASIIASPLYVA